MIMVQPVSFLHSDEENRLIKELTESVSEICTINLPITSLKTKY